MIPSQIFSPFLAIIIGAGVSATAVPEEAAAVSEPRSVIGKRSFLQSCLGPANDPASFSLSNGRILNGECRRNNGSWRPNSIDLNGCITNNDGYLQWRSNGGYKGSCPNVGLRHTHHGDEGINQVYLWADCYTASGGMRRTEVQLNDRIHNWDGQMVCQP
ncbi:Cyanovirin-N [Rhypophila decipiens]